MPLPSKVKVGPYNYRLDKVRGLSAPVGDALYGLCTPAEQRISIDNSLSPERERTCVLHELLHAMWEVTPLKEDAKEEEVVTGLAPLLYSLLKDNPKLVRYLCE